MSEKFRIFALWDKRPPDPPKPNPSTKFKHHAIKKFSRLVFVSEFQTD